VFFARHDFEIAKIVRTSLRQGLNVMVVQPPLEVHEPKLAVVLLAGETHRRQVGEGRGNGLSPHGVSSLAEGVVAAPLNDGAALAGEHVDGA